MNSEAATSVPLISAREGRVVGDRPTTLLESIPGVVAEARRAHDAWARRSLKDRSRVLHSVVRELHTAHASIAESISRFNGKPVMEALIGEVYPTMATFRFFARKGPKALAPRRISLDAIPFAYSQLEFEPMGVIGVISPWNYPFKLMLQDAPAALIAGNAVVIKVSEHAAAIGAIVEDVMAKSDLPEGLISLIYGAGEVGGALVASGIDKVVFTGSSATGERVYAAAAKAMIPATLEMGGKDAAIILEDADIEDTARGVLWGAMTNSGQVCASIETIYCPEGLKDSFLAKCQTLLETLPAESFGTMNTRFQKDKVEAQINEAIAAGASVVADREPTTEDGEFAMRSVFLEGVPAEAAMRCEETFGPAVAVVGYESLDTVVDQVNGGIYGLTTSIWSRDRGRARELASRIDTGAVTINEHLITPGFPEVPWTGHRASGIGLSMSTLSLVGFSRLRYVYDDRGIVRYRFWRYPYDAAKRAWLSHFIDAKFASGPRKLIGLLRAMPTILLRRNHRWDEPPSNGD